MNHQRLDPGRQASDSLHVTPHSPDQPYFEAWRRRTGRQLAVSGRLSQVASILAAENGGSPEDWCGRLRLMLQGEDPPSIDLLTRIDALLMKPKPAKQAEPSTEQFLF